MRARDEQIRIARANLRMIAATIGMVLERYPLDPPVGADLLRHCVASCAATDALLSGEEEADAVIAHIHHIAQEGSRQ